MDLAGQEGRADLYSRRSRLAAVLVGNGLLRLANAAGGALVGFYLADLARQGRIIDAALVGGLGLVANGVELLGALPFGLLADRVSSRTLLVGGALLGALATQLFGITGLVPVFYLSRTLEGVAAAAGGPALLAHLSDVSRQSSPARRGRVAGLFELSLLIGLSLGTLLGGLTWEGMQAAAFSVMATLYLFVAVLFFWGAESTSRGTTRFSQGPIYGLKRVLQDSQLRRLSPAWLAANAVVGLWLTHTAFQLSGPEARGQYLVGRFSTGQVGWISLLYALVFGVGILLWGLLLGRIGRLRVMVLSLAGMLLASGLLYGLNSSENWPDFFRWVVVLFYAVAVMIQSGLTPAALAYLIAVVGEHQGKGAAMGVYSLLLGLGTALGAGLGGLLAKNMYINGLLLGTVLLALPALLSLALLPEDEGNGRRGSVDYTISS